MRVRAAAQRSLQAVGPMQRAAPRVQVGQKPQEAMPTQVAQGHKAPVAQPRCPLAARPRAQRAARQRERQAVQPLLPPGARKQAVRRQKRPAEPMPGSECNGGQQRDGRSLEHGWHDERYRGSEGNGRQQRDGWSLEHGWHDERHWWFGCSRWWLVDLRPGHAQRKSVWVQFRLGTLRPSGFFQRP